MLDDEAARFSHAVRTKERERKWLRPIGAVTRVLIYMCLFWAMYIFQPENISQKPLAALTLQDIGMTAIWLVVIIILIRALFAPSQNEEIRDAWGGVGVLLLFSALSLVAYWYL